MNLYVHIPFCVSKCRYCAFYSNVRTPADILSEYPNLVVHELELRGCCVAPPHTIYIGGGTPSILGPEGVGALFSLLPTPAQGAEITLEVNPGDVTAELASAMHGCGITRVSIGAQSFDPQTLEFLGRRHTVDETRAAVSTLRHAGFVNISLDLIAAIPGMPSDSFHESLKQAIALQPTHVSVYPLSIEADTCFQREVEAGRMAPPTDEESLESLAGAESTLCHGGYQRYEISNYALPGYECRHNLAVWRGEDYVGIGPAAASREGLERRMNTPDFAAWRRALVAGCLPPAEVETLSDQDDDRERFVTRLRLAEGQCPDSATPTGQRRLEIFRMLEKLGMLRQLQTGSYALTARGLEVADAVMAEF